MRIAMVGAGYVGLVSGACLADFGHEVVCIDKDEAKIAALRAGHSPIYEPGLSELLAANQRAGRLSFTKDIREGMRGAQAVFIAVGTPALPGDGGADMRYVHQAAREIAEAIESFTVVVNKSTSPIGACDMIEEIVAERAPRGRFAIVSNPEFMREIYRPLERNGSPIVVTTRRTAELIKYAANVFLAMKVTFINEIADLCEAVGGDIADVAEGIGRDPRIGRRFLNAGPGFGGSCFPKDTVALTRIATKARSPMRLVETLVDVNIKRKIAMAEKIRSEEH